MDDELFNLRSYPKFMFMDIYGNGHSAWDRMDNQNIDDVIFRAKYIRADLVAERINEARQQGYEAAIENYCIETTKEDE